MEPLAAAWEEMFAKLVAYKKVYGNCNVPDGWKPNLKLANWSSHQKSNYRKGEVAPDRIVRLEQLGFVWNPFDAAWEEMFTALNAYKQSYGDCNVPTVWSENPRLGSWCSTQRQAYKSNKLATNRVKQLEGIGFQLRGRDSKRK